MMAMAFLDATDKAARVGKGWLEHVCNFGNGFAGSAKGGKVRTEELRRRIICWVVVSLVFWDCRWSVAPGKGGGVRGTAVTTWSTATFTSTIIRVTARVMVTGIRRS